MNEVEDEIGSLLPQLRRFAYGLAQSPAEADDLIRTTLDHILKAQAAGQAESDFAARAYRVMRDRWIEMARDPRRQDRSRPTAREVTATISGDAAARAELSYLMRAMGRLPYDQREVVALVTIEGLSYAAAADVLEVPVTIVTNRLVRGRRALLAMLEE